ncbi:MAG: hypothetical protein A2868_00925 [Candidatus Levybacteria bacterium RIFCSPHIGHO2_01_FULL_40_15b]|nr:MAG: hypothetical protein A2868_00925 [Candidatus Levybacteria bacterium RIFCSPHIGHO2_01_FULL_40_15b]
MKKVLSSIIVIGVIGSAAIGLSSAFFSDSETSQDNSFVAGELDLKIDNESYLNGVFNQDTSWNLDDLTDQLFFDFNDIKPDDYGEDTISLHAENDYWACMEMQITKDDDNTCTEPELLDDINCSEPGAGQGELGGLLNFAFWPDDGDNVLEDDENIFLETGIASTVLNSSVSLADSSQSIFPTPGPLPGGTTVYIGKAWCFGNMDTLPLTQDGSGTVRDPSLDNNATGGPGTPEDGGFTCDGTGLDNATQSDILMGDISFSATQARNNPDFLCEPVEISCETDDVQFASSSSNNNQGLRKDGTAVLANRSVPSAAFGSPQSTGIPVDPAVPAGSFFSLGFPHTNNGNTPGSIVYGFTEPFFNGPGDDLQVFEITGATTPPYPDEIVKVEIGPTSAGPWTVVAAAAIRDELIDINPIVSAQFVRLTDVSDINLFSGTGDATPDGYDLDAVKAFCTQVE